MKSVVIALLLIAVLLFVAAEAKRRGGKGKPGGKPDGGRKIKGEFCFFIFYQFYLLPSTKKGNSWLAFSLLI